MTSCMLSDTLQCDDLTCEIRFSDENLHCTYPQDFYLIYEVLQILLDTFLHKNYRL